MNGKTNNDCFDCIHRSIVSGEEMCDRRENLKCADERWFSNFASIILFKCGEKGRYFESRSNSQ